MPVLSKEFLDIQSTTECGFNLKHVRDTIRTYSQMHHTDKYSWHSSIIWPVWSNGWVFDYELSGCGCGFKSHCSHLYNFMIKIIYNKQLGHFIGGVIKHFGGVIEISFLCWYCKFWIYYITNTMFNRNLGVGGGYEGGRGNLTPSLGFPLITPKR